MAHSIVGGLMVYILLHVRVVGIARPAVSAHGQAGALADAIGMQLMVTD